MDRKALEDELRRLRNELEDLEETVGFNLLNTGKEQWERLLFRMRIEFEFGLESTIRRRGRPMKEAIGRIK